MDISSLLEFNDPVGSRERIVDAMQDASPDEVRTLKSQLARSHGLVREFEVARSILIDARHQTGASAEANAFVELEWGRCFCSATHDPSQVTAADRETAMTAFLAARDFAESAGRDDLAIDALHMLAFAEIAPERQLEWTRVALEVAERSKQENARKWRASLNNNLGYALHQSKKFEDALLHFERALELRQQQGNAQNIRIAKWMIAWSLRFLSRQTEAIAMQEQLEMECAQAGEPDVHVFNELATLHANAGDHAKADRYRKLARSARGIKRLITAS